jgi:hypothetical protein
MRGTPLGAGEVALPDLAISRLRLSFARPRDYQQRRYLGSAWRGVLGHALKKLVCIARCERCEDCIIYRSCVYTYVFETPLPESAGKLRLYKTVPHPFVLAPPWPGEQLEIGDTELELTLFGRGNQYIAYVVCALKEAAQKGLRGLGSLALESVAQEDLSAPGTWLSIYDETRLSPLPPATPHAPPLPASVRIRLLTPLRLRHQERYVGPEEFTFADLFSSLLRRISSLTYFHTERPLETDFAGLKAAARQVSIEQPDLRWCDWTRYSSRQAEELQMGGLMGAFTVNLGEQPELWPFIWLGQWTHAGKGTSMGLGRYVVETPGRS